MSVTIKGAIEWFERRAKEAPGKGSREAFLLAVEALREKAERDDPKPLTLDELRQMDGEPVYLIYNDYRKNEWVVFDCHNDNGFGTPDQSWWCAENYGKFWNAYRHKPKEASDECSK